MADKSKWHRGEWTLEPDEKHWTDEATGMRCVVLRGPVGAWCGYVGVQHDHPAYGRSYFKSDYTIEEVLSGMAGRDAPTQLLVNNIEVHGGLTFASVTMRDEPEGTFWFGFDCSHAGDFCPNYNDLKQLGAATGWGGKVEYRDLAYVMGQCVVLAKQLSVIANASPHADSSLASVNPPPYQVKEEGV